MRSLVYIGLVGLFVVAAVGPGSRIGHASEDRPRTLKIVKKLEVGRAFSGIPVGFHLLTHPPYQYAAYYNGNRRLVVASRRLGGRRWRKVALQERVPWDSHNYVTMAVDRTGRLHLAANMHVDPLNYYRTEEPHDIRTFKQINRMVGSEEEQCTYPKFMRGPKGRLIFMYRSGSSGNGKRLINLYDAEARRWRRLLDQPLLDGQGRMNAYPHPPLRGPEGRFHVAWVWRNTPDADTNHDISHMQSADLKNWTTASGEPLSLPVTPENKKVVVDPVQPDQGLINSSFDLGFDHQGRVVVTYHKYDDKGRSQIYNARWEENQWTIYQTSDFDFRWEFGGGGSLPGPSVDAHAVRALKDNRLVQHYGTLKGGGTWVLDPGTLKPTGQTRVGFRVPGVARRKHSDFPEMRVRFTGDSGEAAEPGVQYKLRYESLGSNRDQKRTGKLPGASRLILYKFQEPEKP